MNSRQVVLISMFLSVAIYLLASARASDITNRLAKVKQVSAVPSGSITPNGGGV